MRTIVLLWLAAFSSTALAQVGTTGTSGREEFTAVAISSGGPRTTPVAANLDIVIERWSTAAERQRLIDAIRKGQSTALEVMRELPRVGYIRTGSNLGWDLHYAHQSPGEDGGRRIFLGTDRPVSFAEEVTRPRSIDYPFTFIEMHMTGDGEGEGTLSRATRVTASDDGRFVQLENWGVDPVKLTEITRR